MMKERAKETEKKGIKFNLIETGENTHEELNVLASGLPASTEGVPVFVVHTLYL